MHDHSRCECIVWRQGAQRCELWSVGEQGILKVFDGSVMTHEETFTHEEPFVRGTWYQRAQDLRRRAIGDTLRRSEPHES